MNRLTESAYPSWSSSSLDPFLALADAGLVSGMPVEMMRQRLRTLGLPYSESEEVVQAAIGERFCHCLYCNLTYKHTIVGCTNCGRRLVLEENKLSRPVTRS